MITVFTPLSKSGNQYIEATYKSLREQTLPEFEWVVLENHGGVLPKHIRKDPRVKCYGDTQLEGIGALKRRACELSCEESTMLFELDHDDLLHETALEKCVKALEHADFAYSDTSEFKDGSWLPNDPFLSGCGWRTYPVQFQGHDLFAYHQPPPTPHNLRLIDFAPNHFRAFTKKAYWSVGGHNPELDVADDHELMIKFLLAEKTFQHVPECLYFYRVHQNQTTNGSQKNARIRELTQMLYDRYIGELAAHYCRNEGAAYNRGRPLKKIDLCGGINPAPGFEPLDLTLGHDLNQPWPLDPNSVGVLRAYDAIEHLKNPIHVMNEAYRVLAPGGFFLIRVPSTDGRGAFQDPTHVSFWNSNSFWYYTKESHAKYIRSAGYEGRFQTALLRNGYPYAGCADHLIVYCDAHLIALKEGYDPMGLVEI